MINKNYIKGGGYLPQLTENTKTRQKGGENMGKSKANGNTNNKNKNCCALSSECTELLKNLSKRVEFVYDVIINNEIKCKLIDAGIEPDQIDFAISSIRTDMNDGKSFENAFNDFLTANESIFSTDEKVRADRVTKWFIKLNPGIEKYLEEV